MGAPVSEGDILAGKYRVERVLGVGGMGVVVSARHIELDELVALKFLLPEVLDMPEAVGRFLREARAAVRIKSEHVARVTDVGQLATGAPYMVMEYLEGNDLSAVLETRGRLPVEDVVDYVVQACEAIAEAHAIGIVHRDLKPSNLMLVQGTDGADCIKLLDFGISKVSTPGENQMAMTRTTTMLGSPLYMSPEQMMSARDVDGRADIWALGTILYELLTGVPPFVADTLPMLGVLIATVDPAPIREKRPDVPVGLDAIAARCLAKKREDRYPTVAALAEALSPFAPARSRASIDRALRILNKARGATGGPASASQMAMPAVVAASTQQEPAAKTALNWGNTAPGVSPRWGIAAGVGALVFVGLILFAIFHHGAAATQVTAQSEPTRTATIAAPVAAPVATLPPLETVQVAPAAAPTPIPDTTPSAAPAATPDAPTTAVAGIRAHKRMAPLAAPKPGATAGAAAAPAKPIQKKSAYDDM